LLTQTILQILAHWLRKSLESTWLWKWSYTQYYVN